MTTHPKTHNRLPVRRGRRGFTLIEMLMAASLGVVVSGACIGLFAAIQRADTRSKERTASIEAMSRLHRTLQRTMRTVLLDLPPSRPGGGGNSSAEPPKTRVSLLEGADGMQRLEVTLSQPPILGLVAGKSVDPVSMYQAVRGVFEMRQPTTAASIRSGKPAPIELWWTPYEQGTETARPEASVKVADSIESLQIRFAKTNERKQLEKMKTASFADWSQIPAYVEVQVTTIDGNKAQWMFEVSGTTGMEPGQNQADADLPAAVTERFRGVMAARNDDGDSDHTASGGTNSSNASNGRDTASSGGSKNSDSPDGTSHFNDSGSSSSGSSSGSSGSSGSSSGSSSAGGGAGSTRQPTIAELIAEFYRRLAERDGVRYNDNPDEW